MTTSADILRQARDLIAVPEHWCQRVLARSASGKSVPSASAEAVSWCMLGAVDRVAGRDNEHQRVRAAKALRAAIGPLTIAGYNDLRGRCHHEVIAAFDRAIEIADKWRG